MLSNNNQDKIIYRTLSPFAIIKLLLARLILVVLIISGINHFNENSIVITIIVGLLTLMLLKVGNENIIVYENRFVYQYGLLIKSWIWRRKYYFTNIEKVDCKGIFSKGLDILTDRLPIAVDPYNKIDIVFKDGNTEEVDSRIYKQDLKKAIQAISAQLEKVNSKETAHNMGLPQAWRL